jgi:hypothetical protein
VSGVGQAVPDTTVDVTGCDGMGLRAEPEWKMLGGSSAGVRHSLTYGVLSPERGGNQTRWGGVLVSGRIRISPAAPWC